MSSEETIPIGAVAIIGMAGRFPGATTLERFWQNLAGGVESISRFTDEELLAEGVDPTFLKHPNYVKAGGFLEDADKFPAAFFGFTPREAEVMAPQHRLFLECAWEALEDGGYVGEAYPGKIGVFGGMNFNSYLLNNIYSNPELLQTMGGNQLLLSNVDDFLCTRTSYKLNLKGPSISVQTACSTALVAVSLAYFSLLNYQSDMALAGGVSVNSPQKAGYLYQEGGITSPDGHTRAFDARAQGCVWGNGVGIVLLKRLEDALADGDHIYAVIRGAAINNDGSMKVGYTAPSVEAQAEVVLMAQALADIEPETISYIEAHGTATALGDPIELTALTRAFRQRTDKRGYCAIGSVKSNVGHLDPAAGIAGLIKTVLALKHKQLPPTLHFESPNPQIDFESSPFFVNQSLRLWESNGSPRRAGVNSLGMGGTNAHVVLEEAPSRAPRPAQRPLYPLLLSAQEPATLTQVATRLAAHLETHPEQSLADVAHTLMVGRKAFGSRRVLLSESTEEAIRLLRAPAEQQPLSAHEVRGERPVVLLFPGPAALDIDMGRALYDTEPLFREMVDRSSAMLEATLDLPLSAILYPEPGQEAEARALLSEPLIALPALFTLSYALAHLWLSWGVEPQGLAGEGVGELVAATVAGVFQHEDALLLLAHLGQLLQDLPKAQRLAVSLSPTELEPLLSEGMSLVALRSATSGVVRGPAAAIDALVAELSRQDVAVGHLSYDDPLHSVSLDGILEPFRERVASVKRQPPRLPLLASATGRWMSAEEAQSPEYWSTLLQQPVRVAEMLEALSGLRQGVLLEVGPGSDLTSLARELPRGQRAVASLPRSGDEEYRGFLESWSHLWLQGVALDQRAFFAHEPRYRVPLPTYPFVRERYWLEPRPVALVETTERAGQGIALSPSDDANAPRTPTERFLAHCWTELLGVPQVGVHDNFFQLGGDSMMSLQLVSNIQEAGFTLNFQMFMEHQTIAELAAALAGQEVLLEEPAAPPTASLAAPLLVAPKEQLVRLQAGQEGVAPLFLIPPANANLFPYSRLTAYLDNSRPVYALHPLDESLLAARTLQDVANEFVNAILSVQKRGPYHLVGWSAGGPFAFEIAQQMRQRSEAVGLLCMLDCSLGQNSLVFAQLTMGLVQASGFFAWLHRSGAAGQRLLRAIANAMLRYRAGSMRQRIEPHARLGALMGYARWLEGSYGVTLDVTPEQLLPLSLDEQLATLRAQMEQRSVQVDPQLWDNIARWVTTTLKMSALIDSYEPEVFPGTIRYLRAIEPMAEEPELEWAGPKDETRGVAAFCQEATVYRVAGNHITMMEEPYVQVVAEKLRQALQVAQDAPAWQPATPTPRPSRSFAWVQVAMVLALLSLLVWLALQWYG